MLVFVRKYYKMLDMIGETAVIFVPGNDKVATQQTWETVLSNHLLINQRATHIRRA